MFLPSARVRVYVCREAIDMRCSFDGLSGKVRSILKQDPLSGHLFCFFNRRRTYVKALYWNQSGYCLWAKRLVRGTFAVPEKQEVSLGELQGVLEGFEVAMTKRRKRFSFVRPD